MLQKQNNVFVWNDYQCWRNDVLCLLNDFVDESVLDELKRNPPEYIVADKLDWLDGAIRKAKGLSHSDISTVFSQRFQVHYKFVRGFHGCRAESEESYRIHGICLSNLATLNEIARIRFQQKNSVEDAIKSMDEKGARKGREGLVCYCIQPELLVERWGDPLLYGSEYLLCIATGIGEEEILRRHGRAMIIECNVPTIEIPVGYLKCLLGQILREIGERVCFQPTEKIINFGFEVPRKLEPHNIVGFHFPTKIWNQATRRFES